MAPTRLMMLAGVLLWACGTGGANQAHKGSGGSANGGSAGLGTAGWPGTAGFPGTGGNTGGTGGATGGTGGTSGGSGGTAGGSGGSGGAPLPCDSRFSFSANPATAGVPFQIHFTDSPGYTYVGMNVTGPGTPKTTWVGVSGTPHTWTWTVSGHGAGVLDFTFVKNANGTPGTAVGSCQIYSISGSGTGGSGTGGSGTGGSGTGGSGTGGSGTGGSGTGGSGTGGSGGGPVGNCSDQPKRNRFAMNIDPANPGGNPSAAALRAIGARWARIEYKHGITQQSQIAALRSGGIRVMLLVDYSSVGTASPGTSGSSSAWSSYETQYISKLSSLVSTFGSGIDAWEIWNEPDLTANGGYDPYVPPATFGQMLKDAYSTVHAKSSAPVIVGGLASGNPNYLTQAKNAVGGLYADAVGIHPYGQRAPNGWPNSSWGFGDMSTLFSNYLAFGKPLWLTEIGTTDSTNQAQYLKNVYNLAASYGSQVPEVFWFCWSDAMVSPFGVLDSSGGHKAAYAAYQSVAPAWDSSCE